MKVAHGLEGPEALQRRRQHDDQCHGELEDRVVHQARGQTRQNWRLRALCDLGEQGEQCYGGEDSQPLIPVVTAEKIKVASGGGLAPGVGRGLEEPSQRQKKEGGVREFVVLLYFLIHLFPGRTVPCQKNAKGNAEAGHDGMNQESAG